jgi:phage terminase large subunit-like protein
MGQSRNYVEIGLAYAADVVSGKILACKEVRAACQRQLSDLERPDDWPYDFDVAKANRACGFIELLPHIEGSWDSPTIILQPWQCFIVTTIFGWVSRETGKRRFRTALIVIPARSGKSTLCAAIGLYLLTLDGEPGAQVYSAAVNRDQAKVVWNVAKAMVERLPRFRQKTGVATHAHSITVENTASYFQPLSRDARSLEGKNAHGVIVDELAAHKTREVFDVLKARTGSRSQPLTLIISTEGDNAVGVFAEQVSYLQQILEGRHVDDSYFGIYYTIPKELDWTSEEAWRCANPNYGVSVFPQSLADACREAQKNPAAQSAFKTRRLNMRVGAAEAYVNVFKWQNECKDENLRLEDFRGEPCVIALDLASKNDIAAKIYLFRDGRKYIPFGRFYLPAEKCTEGNNPNYDVYRGWYEQGLITFTPGNVIDFEQIERDLLEDNELFLVQEVAFDPHQATELSTRMQREGLPMVEIQQRYAFMSEPMKLLQSLVDDGRIAHDGNKVLEWNISNLMAKPNILEEVMPTKMRMENKIDGAVALIMALGRMIVIQPKEEVRPIRFLGR